MLSSQPHTQLSKLVLWAQSTATDYIRTKTNFNLSPVYSTHKSSNHKFPKKHTVTPDTNLHIKKKTANIKTKQNKNQRISPLSIAPVKKKKAHKARTSWYRGPFHRFINTRFLKSILKKYLAALKQWWQLSAPEFW